MYKQKALRSKKRYAHKLFNFERQSYGWNVLNKLKPFFSDINTQEQHSKPATDKIISFMGYVKSDRDRGWILGFCNVFLGS